MRRARPVPPPRATGDRANHSLTSLQSRHSPRDVAFPSSAYAAQHHHLAAQTDDAAVIVPGAYLIGAEGLFKQDPDFWYLTGVESPYSVLVMTKRAGEVHTTLFLPDRYQFAGAEYPMADEGFHRAVWNQPVGRLAPGRTPSWRWA